MATASLASSSYIAADTQHKPFNHKWSHVCQKKPTQQHLLITVTCLLLRFLTDFSIYCPDESLNECDDPSSPSYSTCPLCRAKGGGERAGHLKGCSYRMLYDWKTLTAEDINIVKTFESNLRRLWDRTWTKVAMEFDFSEDDIVFALATYVVTDTMPKDAGELVDYLTVQELEKQNQNALWYAFATSFFKSTETTTGHGFDFDSEVRAAVKDAPQQSLESPQASGWSPDKTTEARQKGEENEMTTYQELMKENHRLMNIRICKGCRQKDADHVIVNCGHVSLCSDCQPRWKHCPVCQTEATKTIRVFLA